MCQMCAFISECVYLHDPQIREFPASTKEKVADAAGTWVKCVEWKNKFLKKFITHGAGLSPLSVYTVNVKVSGGKKQLYLTEYNAIISN